MCVYSCPMLCSSLALCLEQKWHTLPLQQHVCCLVDQFICMCCSAIEVNVRMAEYSPSFPGEVENVLIPLYQSPSLNIELGFQESYPCSTALREHNNTYVSSGNCLSKQPVFTGRTTVIPQPPQSIPIHPTYSQKKNSNG